MLGAGVTGVPIKSKNNESAKLAIAPIWCTMQYAEAFIKIASLSSIVNLESSLTYIF
jgi:hypothetical protein